MATTALERRPATWEEYQALGEDRRAEYIDGCIVVTPYPTRIHQQASHRIADLLDPALPSGFEAIQTWGWMPGPDEFGPDVMVVPPTDGDVRFTGTPVLCVEITSSNRGNDYVTKVAKYAQAGLDHYWILDPQAEVLDVLVREGVHYRLDLQVTRDQLARVDLGVASVLVDLDQVLR